MVTVSTQSSEVVDEALARLASAGAVERLLDRDATLFSGDPDVRARVDDRLGWVDLADTGADVRSAWSDVAAGAQRDGLTRVVLAGMGGSSLAPEVLARVSGRGSEGLAVADSTHPLAARRVLADLAQTLVLVSSKSGGTIETRSLADIAAQRIGPAQLAAITDPGSDLEAHARDHGWRTAVLAPPDVGGRFSALTAFGMVPAALLGLDPAHLLAAAGRARAGGSSPHHPAAVLAAFLAGHATAGRDKATILATPQLAPLGDWIEQLVAESTGKTGVGITPVVGEPVGPPEAYGRDRVLVELRLDGTPVPGVDAAASDIPRVIIDLDDISDLGGAFWLWEAATALAGHLLGVNPFDEPDVSAAKAATAQVLEELAAGTPLVPPERDDLQAFCAHLSPPTHVAITAWVDPAGADADALGGLRTRIRDLTGCAVTVGIGPRYLHSTGQLHKGGPSDVVGIHVVDAALWSDELAGDDVPGRSWDLATLCRAQAAGDLRTLRDRGRRVAAVPVEPGAVAALLT